MPAQPRFKGPGQWRSQAEKARRPDANLFAELDEMARRLQDMGMAAEAQQVLKAMATAREDPLKAMAMLKETAAAVAAQAPSYGQGLAELVRQLPEQVQEAPGGKVTDDDGIPGMAPH